MKNFKHKIIYNKHTGSIDFVSDVIAKLLWKKQITDIKLILDTKRRKTYTFDYTISDE